MTNQRIPLNILALSLYSGLEFSLIFRNSVAPFFGAIIALSLSGCAGSAQQSALSGQDDKPLVLLATPLQVTYQNELALARLGQLLSTRDLNPDQRAELYYERGVVFDRVGLQTMARLDFNRSLRERPDFAEAYNFIGVYLTQQQSFDDAYEAFDSALELAPDYDYAFLNRGIALYYGKRPELAVQDLGEFYRRKPEDPYRVLWLYLAERELNTEQARKNLERRFKQHSGDEWGWNIVAAYAGDVSPDDFITALAKSSRNNRELAERLCEGYFYLGKLVQAEHKPLLAASYFRLSLANNVYDFIEHRYARLELMLSEPQQQDEQSDNMPL